MSANVFVGHFEPATRAMGPGLRACLWVRGCPIRCPGCATPEFIPMPEEHSYLAVIARPEPKQSRDLGTASSGLPRRLTPYNDPVTIAEVCAWIDRAATEHCIEGVSFSGGEPFAQASALATIAHHAHSHGLSTLAWSGWTRAHLEGPEAPAGSRDLLTQLDVLIDGPYVAALGPSQPLRGSSNQTIHLLTVRYRPEDVARATLEVRIGNDGIVVSGVTDYSTLRATLATFGVR